MLALLCCTGCINKTGDTNIGVNGRCGDGSLERSEDCDDGGEEDGDGCSADCEVEPGWQCSRPGRPCSELEADDTDDESADDTSDDAESSDDKSSEARDDESSSEESGDDSGDDEPSSSDDVSSNPDDETTSSSDDSNVTETSDVTSVTAEPTSEVTEASEPDSGACTPTPSAGIVPKVWTEQIGTTAFDSINALALDSEGNVIVVGSANEALPDVDMDFDYESGPTAFVRKYAPSGEPLWGDQFATGTWTRGLAVGVDADGNVFVAGDTKGQLGEFPGTGEADAFVVKYDKMGSPQWLKQFGTDDWDVPSALATTEEGDIVLVGYTQGVLGTIGDGTYKDGFAVKFGADGARKWTEQFGTAKEDTANAVAVDANGNVFVAGTTEGALAVADNAGASDLFVMAFDADGKDRWTQQLGGEEYDSATAIGVDGCGNVFVTGYTYGTLTERVSEGAYDAALIKFTDEGEQVWLEQFGGGGSDVAYALAIDDEGNVFVAGETDVAFPGQTALGLTDIFVRRYSPDGKEPSTGLFGGDGDDIPLALALDASGKLVLAGSTTSALTSALPAGETDGFVMILDP